MQVFPGQRANSNKMYHDDYVYHQDYRFLNVYRCSQRCREEKCTAGLIVGEEDDEVRVDGLIIIYRIQTWSRIVHCGGILSVWPVRPSIRRGISSGQHLCYSDHAYRKAIKRSWSCELSYELIHSYPAAGGRMSPTAAKSMVSRERKKIRPLVPRTIRALGEMLENYLPSRHFYQGVVSAPGPAGGDPDYAVIFAGRQMLERLNHAQEIHVDGTFDAMPDRPRGIQLYTVLIRHHDRALFRKWKRLGLVGAPPEVLYQAWALPLAPAARFEVGVTVLAAIADRLAEQFREILDFPSYLRRQWIPLAPIVSVNDSPIRTNNIAEAFHRHIVSKLGGPHPQIFVFLEKLGHVINDFDVRLENRTEGPPSRGPHWTNQEFRRVDAQAGLNSGRLTMDQFLVDAIHAGHLRTIEQDAANRADGQDDDVQPPPMELMRDPPGVVPLDPQPAPLPRRRRPAAAGAGRGRRRRPQLLPAVPSRRRPDPYVARVPRVLVVPEGIDAREEPVAVRDLEGINPREEPEPQAVPVAEGIDV